LLFIVCDGLVVGAGNDRPTARIVLDILGVDPALDPEPLLFKSLGDGSHQANYGRVYSGLYEARGHVLPFVVVTKVGKPTERYRPGNRGKRDSQILLMRFLNRVHFDAPMAPLELELMHQLQNVLGVDPKHYEFLLAVDADTEVRSDSLNRLIAVATDDAKIVGLCGETKLANEKTSWITQIQGARVSARHCADALTRLRPRAVYECVIDGLSFGHFRARGVRVALARHRPGAPGEAAS
jgi:chitin synthase